MEADVAALNGLLAESADLRSALASPLVTRGDKAAVLAAVAKKAGFHDLTARFLAVLAKRGRAYLLPEVLAAFSAEMATRRGRVTARVESAHPLTAAQTKAIAKALSTKAAQVELEAAVNPALLGGVVVTLGSVRMDDSLRGKLERLRGRMEKDNAA